MTIANNPKNQTSHAAQGSGQNIYDCGECPTTLGCYGSCMKRKDYPAWVVVDKAGTDDESIVIDYYTFEAAKSYRDQMAEDFDALDIMKRLPDGTLTTEF